MAASYPAGYDTVPVPPANLSGPPLHSTLHLQLKEILEAMQQEMGLNPSGADASIAATLAALNARYAPVTRGEIAYAEQAAAQGPSGPAIFDIPGLTVTFAAVTGRKYEVVGNCELSTNSGALAVLTLWLTDSANAVSNARNHSVAAGGYGSFQVMRRITAVATGNLTYKLRASASAGTLNACDGASNIGVIRVHEVG